MDAKCEHAIQFMSGADDSWIAVNSGVVRAKYGTLNLPDVASGFNLWNGLQGK